MWRTIYLVFSSRKFIIALAGAIAAVSADAGFNVSIETIVGIISMFVAAIAGQAHEDAAKFKAQTLPNPQMQPQQNLTVNVPSSPETRKEQDNAPNPTTP